MSVSSPPYRFNSAIVREPSTTVTRGIRAELGPDPDFAKLTAEFSAYVRALGEAGLDIISLPPTERYPDAVFTEDPALVFSNGAVLLRAGASSRQGEAEELAPTLNDRFPVLLRQNEGFADGGDILLTAKGIFIGLSSRTDRQGAECVARLVKKLGLIAKIVETPKGALHLKSECSLIDDETILMTPQIARSGIFDGFAKIITPAGEEAAANALRVNDVLFISDAFAGVCDILSAQGFDLVKLPTREISKLDAGLSCMSLRWWSVEH